MPARSGGESPALRRSAPAVRTRPQGTREPLPGSMGAPTDADRGRSGAPLLDGSGAQAGGAVTLCDPRPLRLRALPHGGSLRMRRLSMLSRKPIRCVAPDGSPTPGACGRSAAAGGPRPRGSRCGPAAPASCPQSRSRRRFPPVLSRELLPRPGLFLASAERRDAGVGASARQSVGEPWRSGWSQIDSSSRSQSAQMSGGAPAANEYWTPPRSEW